MTESTASRNLCKIRRSPLGMLFVINFLLWPVLMAQAGKKQTFNGADGNKVEVEVLDNPTKVYEENGDLYLIPGQTYKFKMTGTAGAGYVVKGTKTVTSGNLTVDADKPKSLLDVGQMIFKDSENSIIVAVKIKVVIPDFKSLSVTGAVAPGLLELKNGGYQLGGGTLPHVGIVTVKPVAARQEFEIHMEQWINVKTTKKNK